MGGWILLFVAAGFAPAQLGTYHSEETCNAAIRAIFERKLGSNDLKNAVIQNAIRNGLKYQVEYVCVKQ